MYNRLSKRCISKIKKRTNTLSKKKLHCHTQEVKQRKQLWNYLFEKYENLCCDISVGTDCPGDWTIYLDEKYRYFMNCDCNSLNIGTKCDTKSCSAHNTPSELTDSGVDFNSAIDSVTEFSICSPDSHGENGVNCNLRLGEKNVVSTIVESSILNHNVNLSPEKVYSGKIAQSLEECERNNSEKNSSERSSKCTYRNTKPKIDCKHAEILSNQKAVACPSNAYLENEIPKRFNNIRFDIFQNNCLSPIQSGSENQDTDVLILFDKRDSGVNQFGPVENSGINKDDHINGDLQHKYVVRPEIIQNNCCNDVECKLAESQKNERNRCKKTENSHNQVLCNAFSKLDPVNVLNARHENEQDNFSSAPQLHLLRDSFASDSFSSTCQKQIVNEKVSQKEYSDVQQLHSCSLEHTDFLSNSKDSSHGTNLFYPTPYTTNTIKEQNKASDLSHISQCFIDLSYSKVSVMKMCDNEKKIKKELVQEKSYDKKKARLTNLCSKIDCDEKRHQDTQNMREKSEIVSKFDSTKKNKPQKISRKLSKRDMEYSNFVIHHWEEFLNNSGSVLIPVPKKTKKPKLQRLDWQSVMND